MCPNCGSEQTRKWVRDRIDRTLNVTHFMLTFTLPSQLNYLCSSAPELFYREFFWCCAQAIKDILADPKHAGHREWLLWCLAELATEHARSIRISILSFQPSDWILMVALRKSQRTAGSFTAKYSHLD